MTLQPVLAKALAPLEESLTWLNLWRFDKQDEDPWPAVANSVLRRLAADPATTEAVAVALHEELSMETGRGLLCRERAPRIVAALFGEVTP